MFIIRVSLKLSAILYSICLDCMLWRIIAINFDLYMYVMLPFLSSTFTHSRYDSFFCFINDFEYNLFSIS